MSRRFKAQVQMLIDGCSTRQGFDESEDLKPLDSLRVLLGHGEVSQLLEDHHQARLVLTSRNSQL